MTVARSPHEPSGELVGPGPAERSPARVLLVDAATIMRDGVSALLGREPDIEVVAGAGSVREALDLQAQPDVVVTDIELPDRSGGEVVRALAERFTTASVLVLSARDEPAHVRGALDSGAAGYLLKSAATADLAAAIRAVHRGETYLQPSLGVALARQPAAGAAPESRSGAAAGERAVAGGLTAQEVEVLHLLALGYTNAEIAQRVGLSIRSVEGHRARIRTKLGGRNRADLVRGAHLLGLGDAGRAPG